MLIFAKLPRTPNSPSRRALLGALTALTLSAGQLHAQQSFPDKPIRIIVPAAAGGTLDVLTRLIAKGMSESFKQPVVVENRLGAGGLLATQAMLASPADGYTLLAQHSGGFIVHGLTQGPKYELREMTPVAVMASSFFVVTTAVSQPFNDAAAFVAWARKNPQPFSFASSGIGTGTHLAGESFAIASGLDIQHIPYAGDAAMVADVASGRVTLGVAGTSALRLVAAGRLKAVAITADQKSALAKDIPSLREQGFESSFSTFYALVAPKGTPPEVAAAINRAVVALQKLPDNQEKFASNGLVAVGLDVGGTTSYIAGEIARGRAVISKAKIKLD